LFEKAQEIQPGEELLAIGKPYPFRLDIECTHHRPKTNVLQEAWLKGAGGRISTARYHIG
jgi:NADPH-dependent 2,4-dienoyl-CoA reductase/sulfur reductase-like enzyme